ncbi:MAG: hypothetical protein R3F39_15000 [Myxococcota bacterium]
MRAVLICTLLLAPLAGCAAAVHGEVGYVAPFRGEESGGGGAFNAYAGFGRSPVTSSVGVRTKFTDDARQAALSLDIAGMSRVSIFSPYVRGGVHLLQYDKVGDKEAVSIGSPYLEAGVLLVLDTGLATGGSGPGAGVFLSAGGMVEYAIRLGELPNQPYWAAMLGAGFRFALR